MKMSQTSLKRLESEIDSARAAEGAADDESEAGVM
jgi:hypothetical protein